MPSVITDRVNGAVNGAPVRPGSILMTSGVAGTTAITATPFPGVSTYYPNLLVMVRLPAQNTGPTTLDLGPGALPWKTPNGAAHAAGDLSPNLDYLIKLNEAMTEFRTVSPF